MGLTPGHPPGATPLDPDEAEGLMPSHIATQGELNAWEQENVLAGRQWALGRRHENLLTPEFLRDLHRHMFGQTWQWAGQYRKTEKNIGIDPRNIAVAAKELCDDARAQIEHRSYPADEIAARFHHRLTRIHPFPNGNGRHARLMTDVLLRYLGAEAFSWGAGDLVETTAARERYLTALRAADQGDFEPLLRFVCSS